MTDHSPAAQAVLDAFGNTSNGEYIEGVWIVNEQAMLAAALRAAADQVVPSRDVPKIPFDAKRPTVEWHVWNAKQRARAELLAIAAELEGANG